MSEHRLEVADVFRQHDQEYLDRWGHVISTQHLRAFRDICACRTAALGDHVEQCDGCSRQITTYDSCRNRHCPIPAPLQETAIPRYALTLFCASAWAAWNNAFMYANP